MSQKHAVVCDYCKREEEKGNGGGLTWFLVSVNRGTRHFDYDFCTIQCIKDWAETVLDTSAANRGKP